MDELKIQNENEDSLRDSALDELKERVGREHEENQKRKCDVRSGEGSLD